MEPINSNQSGQGMNTNMPPKMANSTAPMGGTAGTGMPMPKHSHKRLYWLLAIFFIVCFGSVAYLSWCVDKDSEWLDSMMKSDRMMYQKDNTKDAAMEEASDIKNATSASASIDAFLNESASVPDGTDFNDSLSDLNQ